MKVGLPRGPASVLPSTLASLNTNSWFASKFTFELRRNSPRCATWPYLDRHVRQSLPKETSGSALWGDGLDWLRRKRCMTQRDTMMGHLVTSCRLTCSSFADMLPNHEGGNQESGNGPVKTPDIWSAGKTVTTLRSTTEPMSRGRTVMSRRLPQTVVIGS